MPEVPSLFEDRAPVEDSVHADGISGQKLGAETHGAPSTPIEGLDTLRSLRPCGVVIQSPVYEVSSAADEARAQALALARSGLPVCLVPADSPDDSDVAAAPAIREQLEHLTHRKLDLARSVLYHATPPPMWNLDYHGRHRVGRATFWTDRIPARWIEPCNAMDEVWVTSKFHETAFAASGIPREKIRVLPSGVDTSVFRPGLPPLPLPRRRAFNFLGIASAHSRHGTELLLRAYLQEFKADEDVSLTLKTRPEKDCAINREAEFVFFIEKELGVPLEKSPTILWLEDSLPASGMPSLYAAADAFVHSTRSASSERMALEALACEVPVIATRWGSSLDFLNDENSCLIDLEGLAPVPGEEFLPGHRWTNPSLDHLRRLLRAVFSGSADNRKRARAGRRQIIEQRDWNAVLPLWRQSFERLLA